MVLRYGSGLNWLKLQRNQLGFIIVRIFILKTSWIVKKVRQPKSHRYKNVSYEGTLFFSIRLDKEFFAFLSNAEHVQVWSRMLPLKTSIRLYQRTTLNSNIPRSQCSLAVVVICQLKGGTTLKQLAAGNKW